MWRDRTNLYISYRITNGNRPTKKSHFASSGAGGIGKNGSTDEEAQGLISPGAFDKDDDDNTVEMDVLPPRWLDVEDQVSDKLAAVQRNMKALETLHQKHVLPGFDDDAIKTREEREIEGMTQDITRDFHFCQSSIRRIESIVREAQQRGTLKDGEETMAKNLQISLATRVADVSSLFRKRQTAYLKKMRALGGLSDVASERSGSSIQNPYTDPSLMETENDRASAQSTLLQTAQKHKQHGNLAAVISQREREIEQIAQGVIDLANIFQQVNSMVIDQGTMLDRVDYNVERTTTNLKAASKELTTANGYQRKSTKRKIILLLILLVVGMGVLVTLKPRRKRSTLPVGSGQQGIPRSPHDFERISNSRRA